MPLMRRKVLLWPSAVKRAIVMALDISLALVSTWLAFSLRLDVLHQPTGKQWWIYGITPVLALFVLRRFGLYQTIFRYSGQAALSTISRATFTYSVLLTALLLYVQWEMVPRSLGLLQPLIFLILVVSSRAFAGLWLEGMGSGNKRKRARLLIFGAGTEGVQTALALAMSRQYLLMGFVDDDAAKVGRHINGIPVFSSAQMQRMVQDHSITDILLAMPSASRARRNDIIESLQGLPVHVRTLPSMNDLASGLISVQDFKELDIEDLLAREPVAPQKELLFATITNQVVLVSGAGGSIGGELCRQIVLLSPSKLVLLEHNEFGLYSIHQELLSLCVAHQLQVELVPILASVTNADKMNAVCLQYAPDTIYHAAAYKHVPLVESNVAAGIVNNVFGTLALAQAAVQSSIRRFVLVSTDKAVRPTNVMGASKRMAELVLQSLADQNSSTCFSMVRFGNVLGSSGSVVPLFRQQLAAGGPITVTHAEVTRYFMTIPEAAQLVLQAGAMAQGGDVFVLDMGEPVKIIDLAKRMVQLAGFTVQDHDHPYGDIKIEITGLLPGEKLYEELIIGDNPQPTQHPRILNAHEHFMAWSDLQHQLTVLQGAAQSDNVPEIKQVLLHCVQGYLSADHSV